MRLQTSILTIIFLPLLGAFILPLLSRISERIRNLFALLLALIPLILSLSLIPLTASGNSFSFSRHFALGFNFTILADGLAVFMACVSTSLSAIIIFYSFGYISHYENRDEYYTMVVLFLAAMLGLIFSGNILLLYIFWEITAITSWRLIGFFREKNHVLAADKAFLVTVFGAVSMLLGFVILYQQYGSFELAVIRQGAGIYPVSNLAIILILAGIFSKSATLPFHTWLPDAGVAPSPVTALLHAAILVKIGVYVFARLFLMNIYIPWHTLITVLAAASALVSAGAALMETDLKRIIAYSTISQIGFIFFGLAAGNSIAAAGALLYILMHGIAKAGLFLCAGIIEQKTKMRDITKMGGLISVMPITAVSFLCCAFSVMGIPPFGGFFSKYLIFSGAAVGTPLWITLLFLLGAFLTIIYLFRVFNLVFLGELHLTQVKEGSLTMVSSVAFLALLSFLSGLLIKYPAEFTQVIVKNMPVFLR